MDLNPIYVWICVGFLLAFAELMTGTLLLLPLSIAAFITAIAPMIGLDLSWQFMVMGALSGLFTPFTIKVIRPRFSPSYTGYGTAGTGAYTGRLYEVKHRDYDGASVISIDGDLFRIRVSGKLSSPSELPKGTLVILERFDGAVAVVNIYPKTDTQK